MYVEVRTFSTENYPKLCATPRLLVSVTFCTNKVNCRFKLKRLIWKVTSAVFPCRSFQSWFQHVMAQNVVSRTAYSVGSPIWERASSRYESDFIRNSPEISVWHIIIYISSRFNSLLFLLEVYFSDEILARPPGISLLSRGPTPGDITKKR